MIHCGKIIHHPYTSTASAAVAYIVNIPWTIPLHFYLLSSLFTPEFCEATGAPISHVFVRSLSVAQTTPIPLNCYAHNVFTILLFIYICFSSAHTMPMYTYARKSHTHEAGWRRDQKKKIGINMTKASKWFSFYLAFIKIPSNISHCFFFKLQRNFPIENIKSLCKTIQKSDIPLKKTKTPKVIVYWLLVI